MQVVIGLGSSLGDRRAALELAVASLAASPRVTLMHTSALYGSPPAGGVARGSFLNAAVLVDWAGSAEQLLTLCQQVELRVGRRRRIRWADRVIDIDLLWAEDTVVCSDTLDLPHPRLADRPFALQPLLDVAPWATDPRTGLPLSALTPGGGCGVWVTGQLPSPHSQLPPEVPLAGAGSASYRAPRHPSSQAGASLRVRHGGSMKIFIDTARIEEIREIHAWGILDGVTTNPSLIAREGGDFIETIHEICTIVDGPVSAEVVAESADEMVRQGLRLAKVHDNVIVKVPLTEAGIAATSRLSAEGIGVNVTLCFQPMQALIAAKAGATYISPFVGRLDDISSSGMDLIAQIVAMYSNYPELDTQVLAASIRHPQHMVDAALMGADVATVPYKVLKKVLKHPLTDSGNAGFNADWEKVGDTDIVAQVDRWLARHKG